ncbi:MAG TPA: hypothetical protein VHA74_00825 [Candidatus Dojkabacteria bacterium]|nr:hypothetical protein [Candidatus Dojkabacteria bacterium]
MEKRTNVVDNSKRGRIILAAAITILGVLFIKLFSKELTVNPLDAFLRGLGYSVLVYLLLVWALKFQVTLYSLLFIIPQSVLFFLTQYYFLEFFFFRRIGRLYEILILMVILVFMFVGTYISFLMANVFNVATIKEIPLIQAGRTASYVLSIVSSYFITYALMDSGINIFVYLPILLISYFLIVLFHLRHSDVEHDRIGVLSIFITTSMFIGIFSTIFLHSQHIVASLIPSAILYIEVGILMNKTRNLLSKMDLMIYTITILTVFVLNFIVS